MSNLPFPAPGDRIVADHPDALTAVLNAALGLTVRSQTALGRIELPSMASNPSSPANYQAWMRSDLGVGGRFHMRHNNGQNVPYLPLRQIVESAELSSFVSITAGSLTDASGLSASITTTGGRLKIYIRPPATNNGSYTAQIDCTGATTQLFAAMAAVCGAVTLQTHWFGLSLVPTSSASWVYVLPLTSCVWYIQPAAGTYTVKIQALVGSSNRLLIPGVAGPSGAALVIEEYGD